MKRDLEELFRQARQRGSIEDLSGVKRGKRGPCPMCSEGRKRDTAFSHSGKGFWKCFRGCGAGDAIKLTAQMKGFDLLTAARWILNLPLDGSGDPHGEAAEPSPEEERRREREAAARARKAQRSADAAAAYHAGVIAELDAAAVSAEASRGVRAWLGVARGLPVADLAGSHAGELLHDALTRLSAVRDAHWSEDFAAGVVHRHPAMMAAIEDHITGELVGRHVTYLTRDGLAKIDAPDARKIWGSAKGGVWLTERDRTLGPLFVGEGIETALSLLAAWRVQQGAAWRDRPGRAVAVLSLDSLQGGWMTDRFGRIDPEFPRADPAKPAITWGGMGEVVIGVDHDMKPRKVKARLLGGGSATIALGATQRMNICARLSALWWQKAGGNVVSIARPPKGMDFNDAWRADQRRAA